MEAINEEIMKQATELVDYYYRDPSVSKTAGRDHDLPFRTYDMDLYHRYLPNYKLTIKPNN